ncbi:MAG: hypothetical protein OXD54_06345 [Candidatus Poribacteria bacterium]|nr:hypothetical protein [Candidatus Poribacteria bacterium]
MNTPSKRISLNLNGNETVSVKGLIAPIEHTLSHFHKEWDALANLRVVEPEKKYPTSVFQCFLPAESVSVGDCWQIGENGVLELLRQLNPNPNLDLDMDHGDSYGLWACLRGYNDRFADIQFRIHADFKLKDGWFTPSQFKGNLRINRIEEEISLFQMYVPDGTVNFDVNWHEDKNEDYTITDAGFCSQMELWTGVEDNTESIDLTESITQDEAERALNLRFYKSDLINWVSPFQVVASAEEQGKLIHVISIDGPLRDESC